MLCKSTDMINDAIESFVRNGGKIEVLPSFEFKPLPPRQPNSEVVKPPRVKKRAAPLSVLSCVAMEDQIIKSGNIKRIMAMAKLGLSLIQISNRTNIPRAVITSLSFRLGFEISNTAVNSRIIQRKVDSL